MPTAVLPWLALAGAIALGCHGSDRPPDAPGPEGLVAFLTNLAGTDAATRRAAVADWELDRAAFDRVVVPTWRKLWDDYHARFAAESPGLVGRLSRAGAITARKHFAGDPKLSPAQARVRLALPVLYPSVVAEIDGAPIDTVFVYDHGWHALAGLDTSVRSYVSHLDHHCGALLDAAGPVNRCTELAAAIIDAALRTDREELGHMCALAASVCGNESP
jgi:hypothetical protein